jgi:peptide/histidine transporter 3/4
LADVCVNGSGIISARYGYFGTFLICTIVMALALCSLMFGKSRFVFHKPTDRSVSTLTRLLFQSPRFHVKGSVFLYGTLVMFLSIFINLAAAATTDSSHLSQALAYISALAVLAGIISWVICGLDPSFLDRAKKSQGGTFDDRQVDGYKALVRVFPMNAFTIVWNCVYDQIDANFQSITQQCDLRWNRSKPDSWQIPGAALGVFDPIVIVLAIPFIDSCIYPLYTKLVGKRPSYYGRMVAGLILAVVGVVWAGIFEILRRNSGALMYNGQPIKDDGSEVPMNHMYWAASIPMYLLVGLAECFINVTAMDWCYASVPLSLKSTAQAVNLLMTSMGSSLTSAFTLMFGGFTPSNDLNEGHLEYMYFAMGVVGVINVVGFIWTMIKMNFGMHDSPVYVEPDEESYPVIDEKEEASLQ